MRTCLACQQKRPKREMLRIVRTPEGTIEIDPKGKRSGRGTYFCSSQACWDVALEPRRLGRALKCRVSAEDVAALRAGLGSLPLAQVVVGSPHEVIEGEISEGKSGNLDAVKGETV